MHTPPLKVAAIMQDFQPDWFIAGGWAIDLYLGKQTRPHEDIEIAIFRSDQIALQNFLNGWTLEKAFKGKLSAWQRGEFLELPVHEIHCSNESAEPARLEVLLNENDKNEWIYRRNEKVRRSLDKFYLISDTGIKYLAPEIVLLYKSKNPRDKDERDFQAAINSLETEPRAWLKSAIAASDSEHRWLQNI